MAKVIFAITDAQARALRAIHAKSDLYWLIDERCITALRQRKLVEPRGSWRDYRLTADGLAVLRLVERLALLPAGNDVSAPKP